MTPRKVDALTQAYQKATQPEEKPQSILDIMPI